MLVQLGLPGTNELDLGEGFMTVADLATWISGVSESTVRRWLRDGRFPGAWQLDNGEWRIPRTAAVEFVENRKPAASMVGSVLTVVGPVARGKNLAFVAKGSGRPSSSSEPRGVPGDDTGED
ncbi:MAG: helix-turn-helix domain-containing protein [Gemmatimonadota bacterium]|nr:MAG: helix-turn-helix domain-containing protein [Gemmatimonadota bacterium]